MNESKCCCNCRHDIRTGKIGNIQCHCEIDGHNINYNQTFEGWCRHWAKDHKFDKEQEHGICNME